MNAGIENLIPFDQRTEEEQRKIREMGGIASGEARKRKRDLKEIFEAAWKVTNKIELKNIRKRLESSEDPMEREILEDEMEVLMESGMQALILMRIATSLKASDPSKIAAVNTMLEHEHGKAKQRTELTGADGKDLIVPTIKDDIS